MKTRTFFLASVLWIASVATDIAQGTAFTYQGQLSDAGQPASSDYELRAILWDSAIGGAQVGPIITNSPVTVNGGYFTTLLDFGRVHSQALLAGSN